MKSEEQELQEGLKKALEKRDGWLAHYYGSQINNRNIIRAKIQQERDDRKREFEERIEKCEIKRLREFDKIRFRKEEQRKRFYGFGIWI